MDIRLNAYVEEPEVLAKAPNVIIVATGGWSVPLAIPGDDLCISSWDVLSGGERPTGTVLLFDEVGDQPASVTAEVIAEVGCTVEFVTPDRMALHDLGPTNAAVALRRLAQLKVDFISLHELAGVTAEGTRRHVTLRQLLSGATQERLVDHVVVEQGVTPNDELYHRLKRFAKNLNHGFS